MEQKTIKNIARGMMISGLAAILLSGAGCFMKGSEIANLSTQKKRLQDFNNQIYYLSLQKPTAYNENVAKIDTLDKMIRSYEESNKVSYILLFGSSILAVGMALYPEDKNKK